MRHEERWGNRAGYGALIVWQKAMDVVEAIYRETSEWPREEQFGLTSQIRRAAVSIPGNIAEDRGRSSDKDYAHHLSIAYRSLCEVETHLTIPHRLRFVDSISHESLLQRSTEVARLLRGLKKRIQADSSSLREIEFDDDSFLMPHGAQRVPGLTPIARRDNDVTRG